jgi:hypothetical protein
MEQEAANSYSHVTRISNIEDGIMSVSVTADKSLVRKPNEE